MEINITTKLQVMLPYLGQKASAIAKPSQPVVMSFTELHDFVAYKKGFMTNFVLFLKPLSKISNEDAKDLGYKDAEMFIATSPWLRKYHGDESFWDAQILQSKGYDLPNYFLNGKTLQEVGLAIYE